MIDLYHRLLEDARSYYSTEVGQGDGLISFVYRKKTLMLGTVFWIYYCVVYCYVIVLCLIHFLFLSHLSVDMASDNWLHFLYVLYYFLLFCQFIFASFIVLIKFNVDRVESKGHPCQLASLIYCGSFIIPAKIFD